MIVFKLIVEFNTKKSKVKGKNYLSTSYKSSPSTNKNYFFLLALLALAARPDLAVAVVFTTECAVSGCFS